MKKKQDVSKNVPCCHFLLIVIVITIMLIYKEFFRTRKMTRMFLRIGLVKILHFVYFQRLFNVIPREEVDYGD